MNSLKDIVVLDLTRFEAGPRCTQLLEQLGAYIIKVEKAYLGDDERTFPPMSEADSIAFPTFNYDKKSLGMDLRSPKAKQILFDLLPHVDVVIQNFRAGTIEKMGLDWDTIHGINPKIIMANNSGFGQDGPYRDRPGVDAVAQCECGLAGSFLKYGNSPIQMGGYPLDHQTALALTISILAALNRRDKTGVGEYIDIDLFSVGLFLFAPELSFFKQCGEEVTLNNKCPNDYYKDINGKYLQISCDNDHWNAFKDTVLVPELFDSKFNLESERFENRVVINSLVAKWAETLEREEIQNRLESVGIPVGLVKGYDELLEDKYLSETEYFHDIAVPYVGDVPYPSVPFKMSNGTFKYGATPKIGENNAEILEKFLGMQLEEVKALEEEGVLYFGEHPCNPPRKK